MANGRSQQYRAINRVERYRWWSIMKLMIDWRQYITHDPAVLRGKATVAGTRIAVDLVLHKLADGLAVADILADYPSLSVESVQACLAYAADLAAGEQTIDLVSGHTQ
jgi:uncharacterized protein (DUF433 family)